MRTSPSPVYYKLLLTNVITNLFIFLVAVVDSPYLTFHRVTRQHMGSYLCIASNGVPPTVSKRITLIVHCTSEKIPSWWIAIKLSRPCYCNSDKSSWILFSFAAVGKKTVLKMYILPSETALCFRTISGALRVSPNPFYTHSCPISVCLFPFEKK